MPQEDSAFLNLAGEFAVASELNRRRVLSSVTYGASKCADVFALSPDMTQVVRIEVKATTPKSKTRWLIGEKGAREPAGVSAAILWVLVLFPTAPEGAPADLARRGEHAPRFFVLSPKEVYQAWKEELDDYNRRRRERGQGPFAGSGVPGVRLKDVEQYEGKWGIILSRLQMAQGPA